MSDVREPLVSTGLYEMQFDGPSLAATLSNAGAYLEQHPEDAKRCIGGTLALDEFEELFLSLLFREGSE